MSALDREKQLYHETRAIAKGFDAQSASVAGVAAERGGAGKRLGRRAAASKQQAELEPEPGTVTIVNLVFGDTPPPSPSREAAPPPIEPLPLAPLAERDAAPPLYAGRAPVYVVAAGLSPEDLLAGARQLQTTLERDLQRLDRMRVLRGQLDALQRRLEAAQAAAAEAQHAYDEVNNELRAHEGDMSFIERCNQLYAERRDGGGAGGAQI